MSSGLSEPPIRLAPARSWTPGVIVALAGSVLAALSASLAWAVQPAPQEVGLYAVNISIPRLISRGSTGNIPYLGFVVVTLAVLAAILVGVMTRRWVDLVRRGLGVIVAVLVALFGFRYAQALEGFPSEVASFPSGLRIGFYLALVGGLLMVLGGRSLRRAVVPVAQPAADEPPAV